MNVEMLMQLDDVSSVDTKMVDLEIHLMNGFVHDQIVENKFRMDIHWMNGTYCYRDDDDDYFQLEENQLNWLM